MSSAPLPDDIPLLDPNDPYAGGKLRKMARTPPHPLGPPTTLPPISVKEQAWNEMKAFFLDTKLNVLLVFVPIAIISNIAGWGDAATFTFAMLGLIPLAERLGFVTEQLAMYTNDTLGGLLNATFGNATEVIISGFALRDGFLRLVQLSLLGSVVSNLLLVMGTAFVAGGIKNKSQRFNQEGINVNCGLLLLAVVAVLLPSLLSETHTSAKGRNSELALSRFESLLLLGCYGLYLVFQLVTHRHLYEEELEEDTKKTDGGPTHGMPRPSSKGNASHQALEMAALASNNGTANGSGGGTKQGGVGEDGNADMESGFRRSYVNGEGDTPRAGGRNSMDGNGGVSHRSMEEEDDDDDGSEEEEKLLSKTGCFIWLGIVTIIISILSEFIVNAIKGASKALHVPMPFLVTILLPIVGNAAEHASAVYFAYKNRIEIALGVALGSSTQISVLVVPFCVVLAWMMGEPLDLNFNGFESMVLFMSVLLAVVVVQDGRANWIKGVLLLLTYFFVSAGFWTHKDGDLSITDVDAA